MAFSVYTFVHAVTVNIDDNIKLLSETPINRGFTLSLK